METIHSLDYKLWKEHFENRRNRGKVMSHRANKLHMPYLTISI